MVRMHFAVSADQAIGINKTNRERKPFNPYSIIFLQVSKNGQVWEWNKN